MKGGAPSTAQHVQHGAAWGRHGAAWGSMGSMGLHGAAWAAWGSMGQHGKHEAAWGSMGQHGQHGVAWGRGAEPGAWWNVGMTQIEVGGGNEMQGVGWAKFSFDQFCLLRTHLPHRWTTPLGLRRISSRF
jgi:hypothetical protein